MRVYSLLAAGLGLLASTATPALAASAVLDLTPKTFDEVVFAGTPGLVEFFAPWCGHCKHLAPVYEELAAAFAHARDRVHVSRVDADAERALGNKFDIQDAGRSGAARLRGAASRSGIAIAA
ncbi:Protein disulfide-isomerase erp38 [Ascosphaera acerosa]|nr:Protein disulfide-isomerase erp38 [Ascosphaera acerosa]